MSNVYKIIKAKIADKSILPLWYRERIKQCEGCPYNSKNKDDLSTKEKALVLVNLGKDVCVICGCAVEDKAAEITEKCSLHKINQKMKWEAVHEGVGSGDIILTNLTPKLGNLTKGDTENKGLKEYIFKYNPLKFRAKAEIEISLEAEKGKELTDFNASSSCGCAVTEMRTHLKAGIIKIKYDTKRIGDFNKTVSISFMEEEKHRKVIIKISGSVKY